MGGITNMYTLEINKENTKKVLVQATGENLISVEFDIFSEETVKGKKVKKSVQKQAMGFPLDTTKEEIDEALAKALAAYTSDKVRTDELEKVAGLHKQADETIEELVGPKNKNK